MQAARVEEVVGDYVNLKKRGANYIGLCPFHNEKTPSFNVSAVKGIFKCFGCGKSGSAVGFLMEHEHMTYPDALRVLAKRYNIEVPEEAPSEEDLLVMDKRESLFVVMEFARKHFMQQLTETDTGKSIGLSYFRERGYSDDTLERFQLGYAPEGFEVLLHIAKERGYEADLLKEVGLAGEKDGCAYDFFRDRVIFPIHNVSGKVIAFAGRTLRTDKKVPKYINSPETLIYEKSKVLYGMHLAKGPIRQADNCLLVEGYTDVITLHQGGIANVVASSGTSLTRDQVALIRRYAPLVTMLYDGDMAGINAAMRGVDIILEEGLQVKVVVLPEGEDPDSYLKRVGPARFTEYVAAQARDFVLFKLGRALEGAADDPMQRAGIVRDMVGTIALIPDPIARSTYLREVAHLMEVREQLLVNELNKVLRQRLRERARQEGRPISKPEDEALARSIEEEEDTGGRRIFDTSHQERDLVRVLLEYGQEAYTEELNVAEFVLNELDALKDDFGIRSNVMGKVYQDIISFYRSKVDEEGTVPSSQMLIHHPDEKVRQTCVDILAQNYQLSDNWEKRHGIITEEVAYRNDVLSAVCRYMLKLLMYELDNVGNELKETKDIEGQMKHQKRMVELKNWERKIAHDLRMVILR